MKLSPPAVQQQVSQIDNDLKARASAYNNLKGNLQNLERKNAWVNSNFQINSYFLGGLFRMHYLGFILLYI